MIQKVFLLAIAACLLVIAPLLADELQNRRISNNRAGDHVGDEVEDAHRDHDHDRHDGHHERNVRDRDDEHEEHAEHHRHSDEEADEGEHQHEHGDDAARKNLAEFEHAILQLRREESLLQRHNPRDPEIDHVRNTIAMLERSVEMHEHEHEHGDHEHGDHDRDDHEHGDHDRGDHEHDERHIDPRERIEHLHIAAKHLSIAGLDEEAEHVFRRAEEMERELFGHDNNRINEVLGDLMEQIRDLRNEVRSLRNEIREKR